MSVAGNPNQSSALVKQPIRMTAIHRGQKIIDQIFQHTPIRLGRLLDNDIVLPFDFVSRYHCELRFEDGQWQAVDLGSKNGLLDDATKRVSDLVLEDGGTFRIQEVTLHLVFETAANLAQDFAPINEIAGPAISISGHPQQSLTPSATEPSKVSDGKSSSRPSSTSPASKKSRRADSRPEAHGGRRPLIDYDVANGFLCPHPSAHQAKERAVQMVVIWHDQVIDAREVPVGASLVWDFLGDSFTLGTVKRDKMKVKVPKGCKSVNHDGSEGAGSKELTLEEPCAFRAHASLMVALRYVPKSRELARQTSWIEEKLVDPLLVSSAVHGSVALTAILVSPKHKVKPIEEPERFATIIVAPTPPPTLVALKPTPTPPPLPVPTPSPTPIAKVEPPKTPPKEVKAKVVVDNKKRRKVAVARKEDPGVKQPPVKPPPPMPEPPKEIAKNEEPPTKIEAVEKEPAPAPTPVFEAKKVGALAMLSKLNAGPATDLPNVEKIQFSRAPASVSGSVIGREVVNGTGNIESKLHQSAKGGGTGKGDGVAGVAVGKNAGGAYKTAGLKGAGTRKIRGTVVGGATYSELSKTEGLTREQVMKVVQEHQSQIQACYERSLMTNPDLLGRAEFEWEITPKGSVTFVKVKEATLKNGENLLDCVKGVFGKMKFPVAKNGEATTPTIGLPFGRL